MYLDPNLNIQGDLVLIDNPTTKVVTYLEIKEQLRIDSNDEQSLLEAYIDAATQMAENYCNRHFITHEYRLYFNEVISSASLIYPDCVLKNNGNQTCVNWIDVNGDAQGNNEAYIDSYSNPSLVYLTSNFTSPTLKDNFANVFWYEFKTGFGDNATDTPEAIKQAIKLIVADMYYFREDRKRAFPMASQILLQPYKCYH